jgi:hypothetical protein
MWIFILRFQPSTPSYSGLSLFYSSLSPPAILHWCRPREGGTRTQSADEEVAQLGGGHDVRKATTI